MAVCATPCGTVTFVDSARIAQSPARIRIGMCDSGDESGGQTMLMLAALMLAARLLLAAIFGIAATAKLLDPSGARRVIATFGVPGVAAVILARAVVAVEFGVAALLLTEPRYGALAALIALTGFSAAVLLSLARGRSLECHCFGRLSKEPMGWPTLARNGCFAGLAVFVAADGRFSWALTAFVTAMLVPWTGRMLYRRRSARAGTTAAGVALPDRAGTSWTVARLLEGHKPLILVFSQPACGACRELLPDVVGWQRDDRVTVALVNGGPADHGVPVELSDRRRAWFTAYNITATPSAVLIDGDGHPVEAAARGAGAIRKLVDGAVPASEQVSAANRFTRRRLLGRATVGLASAGVLSAAACDSSGKRTDTNALEVDGAWLCNQTFALCTTAPCTPSTTDPNISVCDCVVVNGYSVGFKPCPERAQSGDKVRSAFSTVNVNANFGVLSCPSGVPWANCLDVECEIDPKNPAVAKCQCLTVKTGQSLTFGGGCSQATCGSTIWSAATPDLPATTQYRKGMQQLGQAMVEFPKTCAALK